MNNWQMSTAYYSKPDKVDKEAGIIYGVSCNTVGEAKGHGVSLDQEFVNKVVELGNEKKAGIKARFGHPNQCSTALGTFLGRLKNFRVIGNKAVADLFLSNSAKEAPAGNLYDYVLSMATDDADMFGMSICFESGEVYTRNEDGEKDFENLDGEIFAEILKLHACDVVDDPAANEDGLFSSFSGETLAGQFTTFLDDNPGIWEQIKNNDELFNSLINHTDMMNEFFANYNLYKEKIMSKDIVKTDADVAVESVAEVAEPIELAKKKEVEEVEEVVNEELAKKQAEAKQREDRKQLSMLDELVEQYGAEIAVEAMKADDPFKFANGLKIEALNAQIEALSEENERLRAGSSAVPASNGKKERVRLFSK